MEEQKEQALIFAKCAGSLMKGWQVQEQMNCLPQNRQALVNMVLLCTKNETYVAKVEDCALKHGPTVAKVLYCAPKMVHALQMGSTVSQKRTTRCITTKSADAPMLLPCSHNATAVAKVLYLPYQN